MPHAEAHQAGVHAAADAPPACSLHITPRILFGIHAGRCACVCLRLGSAKHSDIGQESSRCCCCPACCGCCGARLRKVFRRCTAAFPARQPAGIPSPHQLMPLPGPAGLTHADQRITEDVERFAHTVCEQRELLCTRHWTRCCMRHLGCKRRTELHLLPPSLNMPGDEYPPHTPGRLASFPPCSRALLLHLQAAAGCGALHALPVPRHGLQAPVCAVW